MKARLAKPSPQSSWPVAAIEGGKDLCLPDALQVLLEEGVQLVACQPRTQPNIVKEIGSSGEEQSARFEHAEEFGCSRGRTAEVFQDKIGVGCIEAVIGKWQAMCIPLASAIELVVVADLRRDVHADQLADRRPDVSCHSAACACSQIEKHPIRLQAT